MPVLADNVDSESCDRVSSERREGQRVCVLTHFGVREWLLPLVMDKQGISLGRKSHLMVRHGVCEEQLLEVHIHVKMKPHSTLNLFNSK